MAMRNFRLIVFRTIRRAYTPGNSRGSLCMLYGLVTFPKLEIFLTRRFLIYHFTNLNLNFVAYNASI